MLLLGHSYGAYLARGVAARRPDSLLGLALLCPGSYVFANTDPDSIHFMILQRVKPGTTDAQIQAAFGSNSQGPPSFAMSGPSAGNDVVSPGTTIRVAYNLPAGTYVLLCFIADTVTGMPHAIMGMHKVITLN